MKSAVAAGELQTKGKGASACFKLAAAKTYKVSVSTTPVRGSGVDLSVPMEKRQHAAKSKTK